MPLEAPVTTATLVLISRAPMDSWANVPTRTRRSRARGSLHRGVGRDRTMRLRDHLIEFRQIAIVGEIAVAHVRAGAVEKHAKIALGDPECLGNLLAGLFVQDAEEHDLPLEACHAQDAPPNPRQFLGARDDGDAVLRTGVE